MYHLEEYFLNSNCTKFGLKDTLKRFTFHNKLQGTIWERKNIISLIFIVLEVLSDIASNFSNSLCRLLDGAIIFVGCVLGVIKNKNVVCGDNKKIKISTFGSNLVITDHVN